MFGFIAQLAIYLSLLLANSAAIASPTDNEFDKCKSIAVAYIEKCLLIEPYYNNTHCWTESEQAYTSCYKKIIKSHSRSNQDAYKKAYKKAEEQAKAIQKK